MKAENAGHEGGPRVLIGPRKMKKNVVRLAVKYKSETCCWTQKLKGEDYGVDKYWVRLAFVKE